MSILSTSLLLLLSTTTSALPSADAKRGPRPNSHARKQSLANCSLSPPPPLPESTLPPTSLTLKHIFLGRGTQNYTCATASSVPVAAGALATLYDVSCLANNDKTRAQLANKFIPDLLGKFSKSVESLLPAKASPAHAGIHYFRADGAPVFVLNDGCSIAAGKVAGCAAPITATGNANGAAVDWLKLARRETEVSAGIEEVYRVQTAGGRAPAACTAEGWITVDYVTEYWMYG